MEVLGKYRGVLGTHAEAGCGARDGVGGHCCS